MAPAAAHNGVRGDDRSELRWEMRHSTSCSVATYHNNSVTVNSFGHDNCLAKMCLSFSSQSSPAGKENIHMLCFTVAQQHRERQRSICTCKASCWYLCLSWWTESEELAPRTAYRSFSAASDIPATTQHWHLTNASITQTSNVELKLSPMAF